MTRANSIAMSKKIVLLVTCFLISQHAVAKRTPTSEDSPSAQRVNLSFLGGLGTTTSQYVGTFLVGVGIPISRTTPLRVLFESGILFGSGTVLPLLLSVQFPLSDQNKPFRPYFTGTVGPVIGLGGTGVLHSAAGGDVLMAFLLRPGGAWHIEERLDVNVEMIIGGFTGLFYIGPNLGMRVYF